MKCVVYSDLLFVLYNCYIVGSSAVAFMREQLSVQNIEGCQASSSLTMQPGSSAVEGRQGAAILKVCFTFFYS
jgi:hypothetical protein